MQFVGATDFQNGVILNSCKVVEIGEFALFPRGLAFTRAGISIRESIDYFCNAGTEFRLDVRKTHCLAVSQYIVQQGCNNFIGVSTVFHDQGCNGHGVSDIGY